MRKVNVDDCSLVPGQIVISKAGHDQGKLYAVVRADGDGAWLADGKVRTMDRPKYKNRKHIQKTLDIITFENGTDGDSRMNDIRIFKAIKAYASKL